MVLISPIFAQPSQPPAVPQVNRVVEAQSTAKTVLPNHVPRWAKQGEDMGEVEAGTPMKMTFVLARSPERQTAFDQMLTDQKIPSSPRYRKWLTPQQIGEQYGPTQHDLDALTKWLNSQGLTDADVAPSGIFVTVTATSDVADNALGVRFHRFKRKDRSQISTTGDPSVPTALIPLVSSIVALSEVPSQPLIQRAGAYKTGLNAGGQPQLSNWTTGVNYISPGDFTKIYDIDPSQNGELDGRGQSVAIVGGSNVNQDDLTNFETLFGLTVNTNKPNRLLPWVRQTAITILLRTIRGSMLHAKPITGISQRC
jgi:subtilase family serine protease